MEIKIGVQSVHRELVVDTDMSAEDVEQALRDSLPDGVLTLTDKRGKIVMVPASAVGFVEIGGEEIRPVGFGGTL
ncbi:DUF3107 domain-containing protein [Bailinhaonella thermotolerans]|uniref:DUF3107 domain-containing protein n=1 Tax=Bailinhaonella thermotolerans TaxID=1070861 RepID=A0A3A4B0M7_9ACTN|nr:DUF3107 domain-containing protein [Bailinhaonella thermotolerans]RJL33488.1 DUF3107 domain-containing protein [Bailinhaonella thermotolerans]